MKTLKLGIENFKTCIEQDYYYVDKTDFIQALIEKGDFINLITRPRRFGKTLMLSTLKHFFEITENNENEKLFEGLNITKYANYHEHMGQYPVIYISFRGIKDNNLDNALAMIYKLIGDEYYRHKEAVDAYHGDSARLVQIKEIQSGSRDKIVYNDSIFLLSKILYEYYKKKVIILIDEYDVPLENAFIEGFYDDMIFFIRTLMETALKTNDNVKFAVMTGCLRISKESVFTGLNNLTVFSVMNKMFAEYFGFTETEVKQILQDYGIVPSVFNELKDWYDGYLFGATEIYNPWSILNAVKGVVNAELRYIQPFWSNTSSNSVVRYLLEHADDNTIAEIEQLMQGETILKMIKEDVTYNDMYDNMTGLWGFLCYTGYLTTVSTEQIGGMTMAQLRIPNREVHYVYENHIKDWTSVMIKESKLEPLFDAILKCKENELCEEINSFLMRTISYNDYQENFYQGLMAGILSGFPKYKIKSNDESGEGRSDIILKHISGGGKAFIFELKYTKNKKTMERLAQDALDQIDLKRYDFDLVEDGYDQIIKIGIVFWRKQCLVKIKN